MYFSCSAMSFFNRLCTFLKCCLKVLMVTVTCNCYSHSFVCWELFDDSCRAAHFSFFWVILRLYKQWMMNITMNDEYHSKLINMFAVILTVHEMLSSQLIFTDRGPISFSPTPPPSLSLSISPPLPLSFYHTLLRLIISF